MANRAEMISSLIIRLGDALIQRYPDESQRYSALSLLLDDAVSSLFSQYTVESLPSNYQQVVLTRANILFLYSVGSSSVYSVDMTSPEGSMKASQVVDNVLKLIKDLEKQLEEDIDDLGLLPENRITFIPKVRRSIYVGDTPRNVRQTPTGEFVLNASYDPSESAVKLFWTKDTFSNRFIAYHLFHSDNQNMLDPSSSVSGVQGVSSDARKIWSSISRNTSGLTLKQGLVTGTNYYLVVVEQGTNNYNLSNIVGVTVP